MTGSTDLMALQASNALAAGRQAPHVGKGLDLRKTREAAQDFEAFFLGQMMQPMFEGVDADEPFGGGAAEQMWRSLEIDEFGKAFARQGGVGIADMVVRQMIQLQENMQKGN